MSLVKLVELGENAYLEVDGENILVSGVMVFTKEILEGIRDKINNACDEVTLKKLDTLKELDRLHELELTPCEEAKNDPGLNKVIQHYQQKLADSVRMSRKEIYGNEVRSN